MYNVRIAASSSAEGFAIWESVVDQWTKSCDETYVHAIGQVL